MPESGERERRGVMTFLGYDRYLDKLIEEETGEETEKSGEDIWSDLQIQEWQVEKEEED